MENEVLLAIVAHKEKLDTLVLRQRKDIKVLKANKALEEFKENLLLVHRERLELVGCKVL